MKIKPAAPAWNLPCLWRRLEVRRMLFVVSYLLLVTNYYPDHYQGQLPITHYYVSNNPHFFLFLKQK